VFLSLLCLKRRTDSIPKGEHIRRVLSRHASNDSMFGRYARESACQELPYVYTQVPGYPELDWERNQYFTLSERHTFSSKIINEASPEYTTVLFFLCHGFVSPFA
jgi:hypothetical protein